MVELLSNFGGTFQNQAADGAPLGRLQSHDLLMASIMLMDAVLLTTGRPSLLFIAFV